MDRQVIRLALIVGLAAAPVAYAQESTDLYDGIDFRRIVQEAKSTVFPAVVYVRCMQESHEAGEKISQEISGSGVLISPDGELLTNWHVVEDAVSVRCLLYDGRALAGRVLGSDQATDLALVKLELPDGSPSLPFADFGDSSALREGDFVMAMGAPWGLNRSVSIGIISCTRRYLPDASEYSLWLQTDAAINPGNSGGPLVNTAGEIVGINTRGMTYGDGMGFAIPAEMVQMLVDPLRQHGRVNWSWTGLQLQPLRDFNRDMYFAGDQGVIVAETDPGSPARLSGFEPRDRIVRVNGAALTATTEEDLPAVRRVLGLLPKDEPAQFQVQRGDDTLTIEITPREKGAVEGEELDCPRWDFTVKSINQFDNEDLFFYRREGVFVYGLKFPGNAVSSGIRESDIILKIDGRDVATLDDVKTLHKELIANVETKHKIRFTLLRAGLMRQAVLDFSRDYSKE